MAGRRKRADDDQSQKYEGFEWQSSEFVKWRQIWIIVNSMGFGLSILGIASQNFTDNKAIVMLLVIAGIIMLVIGVLLDKNKVTKLRNEYTIDPRLDPNDRSKKNVAALKAEVARIEKALQDERDMLAAKEAGKKR